MQQSKISSHMYRGSQHYLTLLIKLHTNVIFVESEQYGNWICVGIWLRSADIKRSKQI